MEDKVIYLDNAATTACAPEASSLNTVTATFTLWPERPSPSTRTSPMPMSSKSSSQTGAVTATSPSGWVIRR